MDKVLVTTLLTMAAVVAAVMVVNTMLPALGRSTSAVLSSSTAATRVDELEGEARVREIARMLGGDPESETSRDHARELLETL